ncbi:hypothetical protein H257_15683 [Aphanomyces astaci]|uniref:Uncharacterized protein n=1 Tax=Aphanomyces astaci TaxID=112090 RepID=W4FLG0_APHAT|nr:hypothetical protein H257_15683 [Aphanomyces astaci]ETV68362.1 hypothetical protein H257_15683 [Aphanomyces astaci]|eukprot:XP_009842157.1 hypothetical protein H257_15683 [Aphanomyces astaci]
MGRTVSNLVVSCCGHFHDDRSPGLCSIPNATQTSKKSALRHENLVSTPPPQVPPKPPTSSYNSVIMSDATTNDKSITDLKFNGWKVMFTT